MLWGYFKEFFNWPTWSTSILVGQWLLPASLSSTTKASQRTPVAMAVSGPGAIKEVPSQQDEADWHHTGRAAGGRRQVLRKAVESRPAKHFPDSEPRDWQTYRAQPRPSNLRPDSRFGYLQGHTLYLRGSTMESHLSVPLRTLCKHIVKEFLKGFMRDSTQKPHDSL